MRIPVPQRAAWSAFGLSGLLALLPAAASGLLATNHSEGPRLQRTHHERTLQFACYCVHHGLRPVLPARYLHTDFIFRNSGEEPLTIGPIERSCGCLVPRMDRQTLQPGEIGRMNVAIEMAEQESGFREFQIVVNYKDPRPKQETLLIKAVFPQPEIQLSPRAMSITQRTDESFEHPFTISDHRQNPLKVLAVESTSSLAEPRIDLVENDGQTTRVAVKFAGGVPPGEHRILLTAQTDDPKFRTVTLPVLLRGPERSEVVRAEPSVVRMPASQDVPQSLTLTLPADWTISHVDTFPPQLKVTWDEPAQSAASRQVELRLRLTGHPGADVREGLVTVHANDGRDMASVRVEFVGP